MIKTFFLHIFLLFNVAVVAAQQLRDTVMEASIDSAVIVDRGRIQNGSTAALFAVGTKIDRVSPEAIERGAALSLAHLIKGETSLYIKEYGRGMLSYISVRGRSSAHTPILWNGIDLSAATMGQTNLSQIPLYFFDNMTLHTGGNSTLYGNGAVGGAVELTTKPIWKEGVSGDLTLSAGSFSTLYTGGTLKYSKGSIYGRSSLFYSLSKNNFEFKNNSRVGHPKERLNNSAYFNGGAMQELYKSFKDSSQLSFTLWYLNFHREIQPSIPLNDRPETYASIDDRSFKGVVKYMGRVKGFSYRILSGFSEDRQLFKEDLIGSFKFFGEVEGEYSYGTMILKGGASIEESVPKGELYAFGAKERRSYLFGVVRYSPNFAQDALLLSAGIRVGEVTNGKIPPMPSLDLKWYLYRRGIHNLSIRGAYSISSRVPTLNDRYWGGISSYLLSESSTTFEGGVEYSMSGDSFGATLSTSLFRSDVENWIRWIPAGQIWKPQNIPNVLSKGVESQFQLTAKFGEYSSNLRINYSYNSIVMVKGLWVEDPATGHQLAFQPHHTFNTTLSVEKGKTMFYTTLSYTGERSTLDIFDLLKPYLLTDIGVEYKSSIFKHRVSIIGTVNNLFGVEYQNVKFYAMPPTNFLITARYYF